MVRHNRLYIFHNIIKYPRGLVPFCFFFFLAKAGECILIVYFAARATQHFFMVSIKVPIHDFDFYFISLVFFFFAHLPSVVNTQYLYYALLSLSRVF